jgi:hypothetical protein
MIEVLEIILPSSVYEIFQLRVSENQILNWHWKHEECFAYKGMKQIGVTDRYTCGVIHRIECWLKDLEIKYRIEPSIDKCSMLESGFCSGDIKIGS